MGRNAGWMLVAVVGALLLVWVCVADWSMPYQENASHKTPEYIRDSLAIALAVEERNKLLSGGSRDTTGMRVSVDSIFYSPDSLKLFAFTVERQRSMSGRVVYSGGAVAAYRPHRDTLWTMYPFGQIRVAGGPNPEETSEVLRRYYLGDAFSEDSMWIISNGEAALRKYEYGPADSLFWSKGLLWQQGALVPNRYFFEDRISGTAGDPLRVVSEEPLPSPYPDSLIDQYSH